MTTTIGVAHLVQVVRDDRASGLGHRAECSCGWAGEWRYDQASAETAGVAHREVAVGPPDRLDGLMSDLLDLQDDLAAAVVWLAEHWSADLPVPHSWGTTRQDRAGVQLMAGCQQGDLARVADAMGVAATDDPVPGRTGHRYRRAVRDFGRVQLEVIALVSPDTEPAR